MTAPDTPLDIALAHAAQGRKVFWLHSVTENGACTCGSAHLDDTSPGGGPRNRGKHPLGKGGFHNATLDVGKIHKEWGRRPYGNVGYWPDEGDVVVDVDGKLGADTLAELEQKLGPLPDTYTVHSGRDDVSRHLYFHAPGVHGRTNAEPGIDIKTHNSGYVVAAGSRHYSGRTYTAADPHRPVAGLPEAWIRHFTKRTPPPPSGEPGGKFQPGGRHRYLVEVAGTLRAKGLGPEAIYQAVWAANLERCDPPHDETKCRAVANDIADRYPPVPNTEQAQFEREVDEQLHDHDTQQGHVDPAGFFDKNGLIVPELGEHILDHDALELGTDQRLWRYHEGAWRPDGDQHVRAQARGVLGERWKKRHTEEVLAWLRATEPSITDRPDPRWINTPNGMLCWRTSTLHTHNPDLHSTVQIPVQWHPEATCPKVDTFLNEVLPNDTIDFIWEVIGYTLYAGNPLHKAVLLLGPGRNGKSVLLRLLRALCGAHNTAAIPLQQLAENRFSAAELYGRLANICGDLDARAIKRSDLFKMITGGDPITAERKYAHPFTFVSIALPIFSANEPPISSDQTEAWFKRWLIVPLERVFTEDQADPHLGDKLTDRHELEGALVQAVAGLQRLMARGRFAAPQSVATAGDQYRERLDTVVAFVNEECHLDPEAWIRRSNLYSAYRLWTQEQGRYPVAAAQFNTKLRSTYPGQVDERKRRGHQGWAGIDTGLGAQL